MKSLKKLRKRSIVLLSAALLLISGVIAAYHKVQVRSTVMRNKPSAFGTRIATLQFNTRVRILSKKGGFLYISSPKGRGYVYKSAIIPQNSFNKQYANLQSSQDYSDSAVTAATKGFADAEVNYRRDRHSDARYDLVERVIKEINFDRSAGWWKNFRRQGNIGEYRRLKKSPYYNYFGRQR